MAKKATAVKTKTSRSSVATPKKSPAPASKSAKAAVKPADKTKAKAARSSAAPASGKSKVTSRPTSIPRKSAPAISESATANTPKIEKSKKVEKNVKPDSPAKHPAAGVKTNLTKDELVHYRSLLLEKRHEILGDVGTMESEAFKQGSNLSNMPIHMADVGTDNFEQEFTLGLIESERQILREIQDALRRIEDGTYGVCQGTGLPIPKVRLEAVPWAKYSLEYARALESGQIRRDLDSSRRDDDDDEE